MKRLSPIPSGRGRRSDAADVWVSFSRGPRLLATLAVLWILACGSWRTTRAAEVLPPLLTTTATTTLDSGGRPWTYIVLEQNRPGLIAAHRFAVYAKTAGGAFSARGVVAPATDATAIGVLLGRGASIGDNLPALESQLVALHALLVTPAGQSPGTNAPAMSLAQRVAALQNRAAGDTSLGALLDLYGLAHPALRLVRGTAWAGRLDVPVGTEATIEIRETDAAGTDVAVVGRGIFHAGQPDRLPAPGPLAALPDASALGDLAVRLRWATPDALRRAGTLHHGDVAWRVSKALAESRGFDKTPPAASVLDGLALSAPGEVRRLAGPIFPAKWFDASTVSDFTADRTNVYLTDDNGRHGIAGVPFDEGSSQYYFVAAADPLGRPGDVSGGLLATVCRHIPPAMPSGLKVAVRSDPTHHSHWEISWAANTSGIGTPTTRYELYRGTDFALLTSAQRGGVDLEANPIPPGDPLRIQKVAVIDDPGGVPGQTLRFVLPGDDAFGKTWWFAVRAVHAGPPDCGDLYSALSPPQVGTLHDTTAAVTPDASLQPPPITDCLRVACIVDKNAATETSADPLDPAVAHYIARCRREPGIGAVHFRVTDLNGNGVVVPETIVVFPQDSDTVDLDWTLPLSKIGDSLKVECQAEAFGRYASDWIPSVASGVDPSGNSLMAHAFHAGAAPQSEIAALAVGNPLFASVKGGCPNTWPADTHLVLSPATGRILHPRFTLPLGPNSKQFRLYRRIEDGPMTLVAQGLRDYTGPGSAVSAEDQAPPVSNGRVHYFSQLLDENGVPGIMRHLANLRFTGDKPPVPVLATPVATDFGGTLAAPTVTLNWVAPPEHAERFEVYFATEQHEGIHDPHIQALVAHLTPKVATVSTRWSVQSRVSALAKYLTGLADGFTTGRVGGELGPGPRFSVAMKVDPSLRYKVWIRALGPGGEPGDPSKFVEFQWQPPASPPANIAWPARPLPPVAAFNPGIQAIDFADVPASRLIWARRSIGITSIATPSVGVDATPVGIRVGSLAIDTDQTSKGFDNVAPLAPVFVAPPGTATHGAADPNQQLFKRAGDAKQLLLPCVLYRTQVANDRFPNVGGDVVQCSPLVRSVAWVAGRVNGVAVAAKLVDPLFRWIGPDYPTVPTLDLYLVDTQPVVRGARYRYWLVRFSDLGEPIQTIPCGEVTVKTP